MTTSDNSSTTFRSGVAVAELASDEVLIYANLEFESV